MKLELIMMLINRAEQKGIFKQYGDTLEDYILQILIVLLEKQT